MNNLLEAWYAVESAGANVPLAAHSDQMGLLQGDTKKFEFPFDTSLEDKVHEIWNWVGEIDDTELKDWDVAKEILYAPQPLSAAGKHAALQASFEFKRRVGARIIREAKKTVAEYEKKVGYTLTNEGGNDSCYKCGQPILEGQVELYGEGGMSQHQDCQAAAADAAQRPQQTPGQKIEELPQRGNPKTPTQLGLQPKQQEVGYSPNMIGSLKVAAPGDELNEPESVEPELPEENLTVPSPGVTEQEVHRDAPATEPTPEAPAVVEPPASFEEPAAEVAPAADVEPPASFEESEEEHEEHSSGTPEVSARAELEAELSDPDLIEAVMEFLKQEDAMGGFEVEEDESEIAKITIGHDDFYIAANDSAAESKAVSMVKDDLSSQPEIFNQEWLSGYIDEEKLRDNLQGGVEEEIRENPDSYGWEAGSKEEEEYEEGVEKLEEDDDQIIDRSLLVPPDEEEETEPSEDWIESKAQEILSNPISYLADIHGQAEALKVAIQMVGIDEDKAAQAAVDEDGAGHFLSSYDGETHELPNGGVYWRT